MTQKLYSTPIDACTAAGVEYPSRGLLPGPWNVSKAFDGKRWKQGAGRVRMFSDGTGGVVWNWITGEAVFWFDDAGKKLTKAERNSLMKRVASGMRNRRAVGRRLRPLRRSCFSRRRLWVSILT